MGTRQMQNLKVEDYSMYGNLFFNLKGLSANSQKKEKQRKFISYIWCSLQHFTTYLSEVINPLFLENFQFILSSADVKESLSRQHECLINGWTPHCSFFQSQDSLLLSSYLMWQNGFRKKLESYIPKYWQWLSLLWCYKWSLYSFPYFATLKFFYN